MRELLLDRLSPRFGYTYKHFGFHRFLHIMAAVDAPTASTEFDFLIVGGMDRTLCADDVLAHTNLLQAARLVILSLVDLLKAIRISRSESLRLVPGKLLTDIHHPWATF
jgi:hypothetical protein